MNAPIILLDIFIVAGLCLALLLAIVVAVYAILQWKFSFLFGIRAKTIDMKVPIKGRDGKAIRSPANAKSDITEYIRKEAFLRKAAFKRATIKMGDSFFDDSDMKAPYRLIVIYEKKTMTPLLTARYFFHKETILSDLKGDDPDYRMTDPDSNQPVEWSDLRLDEFEEGEVFLIDRLAGNFDAPLYNKYRYYIYFLFYKELFVHNSKIKFYYAMARRDRLEKLLSKYIRLGLRIAGMTKHKGKEHWILTADWKKIHLMMKVYGHISTAWTLTNFFNSIGLVKYR